MSEEFLERIHTINLGKVLLSQPQHRATRALNMIREFSRRHMKTEAIKIDEDLARKIWARGARSPPRKIRVRMERNDEGDILVSHYEGAVELDEAETAPPAVEQEPVAGVGTAAVIPSLPEPPAGSAPSDGDGDVTRPDDGGVQTPDDGGVQTPDDGGVQTPDDGAGETAVRKDGGDPVPPETAGRQDGESERQS